MKPSHYWICDADTPVVSNMSANESSINPNDYICINASTTDLWGIIDVMLATITYPNDTVKNVTLADDGSSPSCDDSADDGWYGEILDVGDTAGTFTLNNTWANDTAGNMGEDTTSIDVTIRPKYGSFVRAAFAISLCNRGKTILPILSPRY